MSKASKSSRFRYQLATLLRVREIRERQEQDKFIESEKKLAEEIRKEELARQREIEAYDTLSARMQDKELPNLTEINMRKYHLEAMKEAYLAQIKARQDAEKARDLQREKLNQAVKERKIIEKDKEKTRDAWRKIMNKEDAKFLDDIAGIGFVKKIRDASS